MVAVGVCDQRRPTIHDRKTCKSSVTIHYEEIPSRRLGLNVGDMFDGTILRRDGRELVLRYGTRIHLRRGQNRKRHGVMNGVADIFTKLPRRSWKNA